ncbi:MULTISPECIES: polysaccharide biosynthesis/export family protein [Paracoccus]|nr:MULTISPECIES: polysaccharide biosynthesis/export family protein [Paracoccus]MCU7427613.1 polysaccharide biosynthesis/export family protein [Paracoccus denitrificans]MDK8873159.1 polysaccharide biosynthesis/export family protein [Paracoccus sp. SSJ]QAR24883.1 polysaccharide export protein [Paracoccus denitrificans]UFS64804.1 polysaccharide biosynthesis/export family protein [Paracoccus denitrificans]UPV93946.1 polysaccharide biosynthesis/export family protein [Paracoccus denitrificans]
MLLVSACGLPRSGPTKGQILSSSVTKGGTTHIVNVDDRVNRAASYTPAYGFSADFRAASTVAADDIRPGDVLGLSIWENVDDGLLASMGSSSTQLTELQVDSQGYIFVPYAGRVLAAGNSPEELRRIITQKLETQTPDPQVMVTRVAGDGATVSVMGKVNSQGVYPIERPTRTLSAMLSRSGGVTIEPEIAVITVKRGNSSGKVWLRDLYSSARNDIALRPGDVILVEEDERSFTALGALGGQTKVPLGNEQINAIEAVAMVGGLSTSLADPKGVFVLREEPQTVARAVLGRGDIHGNQRVAYVLDLTKPDGMFLARDFIIRDGDTVYVTEAPFVQWRKTLQSILGTAAEVGSANSAFE